MDEGVEKNIAICYLSREGDKNNCCILTSRRLKISHRKSENIFDHRSIKGLRIERKKLLLPLLAGGIFIPLTLVSFFELSLDPFPVTMMLFAGLVIFYLGWNGSKVLSVITADQSYYYPFRQSNAGIQPFINYSLNRMKRISQSELYYYIILKTGGVTVEDEIKFIAENKENSSVFDYFGILEKINRGEYGEDDIIYIFDPVNSLIRVQYWTEGGLNKIKSFFPESVQAEDFLEIIRVSELKKRVKLSKHGFR